MQAPLRQDIDELVATRVMCAVASLIEQSEGELTFARVSAASGVPERTLYRRYATKAALLEAFWVWLNGKIDVPPQPASSSELAAQIPQLFAAFEADEPLVRAMLHDRNGRETRLAQAETRRARMITALRDELAGLSPKERQRLLASVQLLASAAGWESMKDNWGLSGKQAAEAAQWAVSALVAAARGSRKR